MHYFVPRFKWVGNKAILIPLMIDLGFGKIVTCGFSRKCLLMETVKYFMLDISTVWSPSPWSPAGCSWPCPGARWTQCWCRYHHWLQVACWELWWQMCHQPHHCHLQTCQEHQLVLLSHKQVVTTIIFIFTIIVIIKTITQIAQIFLLHSCLTITVQ